MVADGPEFVDRDQSERAAAEDEVLTAGSPVGLLGRIPVGLRVCLAVAVAAGAVGVALHQTGHSTGAPARTRHGSAPLASAPSAFASEAPRTVQAARQAAAGAGISLASVRADTLDQLAYLADFRHPVQNNLRGAGTTPTCPQIPVGDDPAARAAAAMRRHLHPVALRDSSVTMNADATLCGLTVRAQVTTSVRVIVEIIAPPHAAHTGLRAQRRNGDDVLRAVSITTGGWQTTVGWAGPAAQAPSNTALAAIARDRHLRW